MESFLDRLLTEIVVLFLYNNHFCLKWKSEGVSFDNVIKNEVKDSFKRVNIYITEENAKSFSEYKHIPNKIESHPTKFITSDLETLNTDRSRPYVFCFYRLSNLSSRCDRNLTPDEI